MVAWLAAATVIVSSFRVPALERLQGSTLFKIVTGSLLAGYIAVQWLLSVTRAIGAMRVAKVLYRVHRATGVLAPVALLAHSTAAGHGIVTLLLGLFLFDCALGYANPLLPRQRPRVHAVWLTVHVLVSAALVVLLLIHVWIALTYR